MSRRDDIDPSDIDWIDDNLDSPADIVETGASRGRSRWWFAVAAGALVLVVVIVQLSRSPGHQSAAPAPTHSPSLAVSRVVTPTPEPIPSSIAPQQLVTTTSLGHPILSAAGNWELFALGPGVVIRIQLASGRITKTVIPELDSDGPNSFVVGADRAIVRPLDNVTGYEVPDGQHAGPLPQVMRTGGPALPGPDPAHLWVPGPEESLSTMQLVTFDGRPTGATIKLGNDGNPMSSDGAGYVLFQGIGGIYDARPGGIHRVTDGALLAFGPTRYLTIECTDGYNCAMTVINRSDGSRRALSTKDKTFQPYDGLIAPDGNTAAVLESDTNGQATIHLIDLNTGNDQVTATTVNEPNSPGPDEMVWAPDSRSLFAVDSRGTPVIINRMSGHATGLGVQLPPVNVLALRGSAING
jgi:hypothetical protein